MKALGVLAALAWAVCAGAVSFKESRATQLAKRGEVNFPEPKYFRRSSSRIRCDAVAQGKVADGRNRGVAVCAHSDDTEGLCF